MAITYRDDAALTAAQYIDVLNRSTLGARRPVDDPALIGRALAHSDILVTAWDGGDQLVGAARAITDFHLHCYLADLCVDEAYQRQGIGLELQRRVRALLGTECKLKLSAAPAAAEYYPRVGYARNDRAFELPPGAPLGLA